jgi:hypothetical protein
VDALERVKGDSLVVLAYHASDDFSNTDGNSRMSYYGISGVPTAVFNGGTRVVGGGSSTYSYYLNAYNTEMQIPSPCTLNVLVDYNPDSRLLKVKATVFAVDSMVSTHLRYALAESHLPYRWDDLDSLHHIMRKMLPNAAGVWMLHLGPNDTFVDSQTYTLYARWKDENCYVVVFVQNDSDKSVLRSVKIGSIMPPVYGDANGDGKLDIADAVYLANYVFRQGSAPDPLANGDLNNDCIVNVVDIVYLVNYLFREGPAPSPGCA